MPPAELAPQLWHYCHTCIVFTHSGYINYLKEQMSSCESSFFTLNYFCINIGVDKVKVEAERLPPATNLEHNVSVNLCEITWETSLT